MFRMTRIFRSAALAGVLIISVGCGKDPECAEGTVLEDGLCVSEVTECGPGTEALGGACVSVCRPDHYWDGESCEPIPSCGDGTLFDLESGECVAEGYTCAAGTTEVDGICVPDLVCAEGTRPDSDGVCIPDTLGEPDVSEPADPDHPAAFDLPSPGGRVSLGGIIDTPVDTNDDGYKEPDWDHYVFEAQAGTYLRISGLSRGAVRPAFVIYSVDPHDPSKTDYIRYCLDPNRWSCGREVYLPETGSYELLVSDYNHLAGYLFGTLIAPVGGPEFIYHVIVENLGAPSFSAVDSLPSTVDGDLDDGSLHFFDLAAVQVGVPSVVRSVGAPSEDLESDVFAALILLDAQGKVADSIRTTTYESAELVLAPEEGARYLVIVDHLLIIGPERSYTFQALEPPIESCDDGACSTGSVPMGQEVLLRWDLEKDQFMAARIEAAETTWAAMLATWLDADFEPLLGGTSAVYPGLNGWGRFFAAENEPRYLWLRWDIGDTPFDFEIEEQLRDTPTLTLGITATGLSVDPLPSGSVPDIDHEWALGAAAIENIKLTSGRIVFFDAFTTRTGEWLGTHHEYLVTPDFEPVGPVVNVTAWNFPYGMITPTFAYVRHSGTYVHWVYDTYADLAGATYDVRPISMTPEVAGEVTSQSPIALPFQFLSGGLRFYTVRHAKDLDLEITVTPGTGSTLQPRLWVLNFGRPAWSWVSYVWRADADALLLGLVGREDATEEAEAVTVSYETPYEGMSLVLVMNSGASGGSQHYALDIHVVEE